MQRFCLQTVGGRSETTKYVNDNAIKPAHNFSAFPNCHDKWPNCRLANRNKRLSRCERETWKMVGEENGWEIRGGKMSGGGRGKSKASTCTRPVRDKRTNRPKYFFLSKGEILSTDSLYQRKRVASERYINRRRIPLQRKFDTIFTATN